MEKLCASIRASLVSSLIRRVSRFATSRATCASFVAPVCASSRSCKPDSLIIDFSSAVSASAKRLARPATEVSASASFFALVASAAAFFAAAASRRIRSSEFWVFNDLASSRASRVSRFPERTSSRKPWDVSFALVKSICVSRRVVSISPICVENCVSTVATATETSKAASESVASKALSASTHRRRHSTNSNSTSLKLSYRANALSSAFRCTCFSASVVTSASRHRSSISVWSFSNLLSAKRVRCSASSFASITRPTFISSSSSNEGCTFCDASRNASVSSSLSRDSSSVLVTSFSPTPSFCRFSFSTNADFSCVSVFAASTAAIAFFSSTPRSTTDASATRARSNAVSMRGCFEFNF
mmetsp:Transcript_5787/g.21888  ORF Transcript_5787/g.21888 Transcript_5787/m.21888 type:complete len:359 (+) Transcript_5787:10637-11713(+)